MIDLSPPPARPDPSIYSQSPLIAAGAAATWDNPDIVLHEYPQYTNGAWRFDPAPIFNAKVTVRNKSLTSAAINTVVAVSYGGRGIGMERMPLMTQLVSLAAGEARQLILPPSVPIFLGRVKGTALFVDVSHPYDADPTNNYGENISSISLLGPGASGNTPIFLANITSDPITYVLSLEPNTVGAVLSATQVTVAPGSIVDVIATYGTLLPVPANTSFTVVVRDTQGNLAGGFTSLLYFG